MTRSSCARPSLAVALLGLAVLLGGCGSDRRADESSPREDDRLVVEAAFDTTQITGVAMSGDGRMFVNAPFWTDPHGPSVLEVTSETTATPYPDAEWNRRWQDAAGLDPERTFICVQSVYVDPENSSTLWILDPASPQFSGVIPGGAKLVRVDLDTDTVDQVIPFDSTTAPTGSYLNDVRVSTDQTRAYITDSNLGALVVVNLADGTARRVLDDHPAMAADTSLVLTIGGREFRGLNGEVPQIASDGIALSPDDDYVYVHALTGTHLYRIPTGALNDPNLPADSLGERVEDVGETVVTDGMIAGPDGTIYHTALEADAIVGWHPERGLDTLVTDPRLKWPDSFTLGPDGELRVTTSQIHLMPQYNRNINRRSDPYRVFRYRPEE